MLRVLRGRASALIAAIVAVAGLTTAAFDELLHAGVSHDTACVVASDVAHDASSHRFTAAAEADGPGNHCVGCHFARTPRVGAQDATYAAHGEETRSPRPSPAIGSARAAALDSLPPRAPPRLS